MTTDDRAKFEALTGDEARSIARSVATSASDSPSPAEYVLAGWNAALASAQAASAEPAAPTEGAQAKRTPLEALKTYEPDVFIEESRGRLTATGAAMKQQAAGRWVRLEDVCAALAAQPSQSDDARCRDTYETTSGNTIVCKTCGACWSLGAATACENARNKLARAALASQKEA